MVYNASLTYNYIGVYLTGVKDPIQLAIVTIGTQSALERYGYADCTQAKLPE